MHCKEIAVPSLALFVARTLSLSLSGALGLRWSGNFLQMIRSDFGTFCDMLLGRLGHRSSGSFWCFGKRQPPDGHQHPGHHYPFGHASMISVCLTGWKGLRGKRYWMGFRTILCATAGRPVVLWSLDGVTRDLPLPRSQMRRQGVRFAWRVFERIAIKLASLVAWYHIKTISIPMSDRPAVIRARCLLLFKVTYRPLDGAGKEKKRPLVCCLC